MCKILTWFRKLNSHFASMINPREPFSIAACLMPINSLRVCGTKSIFHYICAAIFCSFQGVDAHKSYDFQ